MASSSAQDALRSQGIAPSQSGAPSSSSACAGFTLGRVMADVWERHTL